MSYDALAVWDVVYGTPIPSSEGGPGLGRALEIRVKCDETVKVGPDGDWTITENWVDVWKEV